MGFNLKTRTVRVVTDEELGIFERQTRFVVCDDKGAVVDDAQGYGYKTEQDAREAAEDAFNNGKYRSVR